jgi:hypothetical protein
MAEVQRRLERWRRAVAGLPLPLRERVRIVSSGRLQLLEREVAAHDDDEDVRL